MKKYLSGIVAVVLAIGFSAFTANHQEKKYGNMQDYTWHKFNAAGTAELSPAVTFTGTDAGAKSAFGCPDGSSVNCARAYDEFGGALNIYVKKTAE